MKTIYTSTNIKETLNYLQKRYSNLNNKKYSIQEIIYAFNKLPGKYQDLLLKNNKDENDKANLSHVYDHFRKTLLVTKNAPSDIKINIKNIKEEEKVKKDSVTLEDVEFDEQNRTKKNDINNDNREKYNNQVKKDNNKEKNAVNQKIKFVILEEYISERQNVNVESTLDKLSLDEDEKFIIMLKYENNNVKTNEEVSKELGVCVSYIDEVVDKYLEQSIEYKKKKLLALERK